MDLARTFLTQALVVNKKIEPLTTLAGKVVIYERLMKLKLSLTRASASAVVGPASTANKAEYEAELTMARGALLKAWKEQTPQLLLGFQMQALSLNCSIKVYLLAKSYKDILLQPIYSKE